MPMVGSSPSYLLLKLSLISPFINCFCLLRISIAFMLFNNSAVSDSLWPHELQHARLPYPSPSPRVFSNSHPLSQWCHPTISSSVIHFLLLPSFFPSIRLFHIRWPKYSSFSFSVNPYNGYSGLTSLGLTGLISLQSKGLSWTLITVIGLV